MKIEELVEHPAHYAEGRQYEPKDVIRDWDLNFNLGSVVKYVARAGRKTTALIDLKKAQQFLQFEIDAIIQETSTDFDNFMNGSIDYPKDDLEMASDVLKEALSQKKRSV